MNISNVSFFTFNAQLNGDFKKIKEMSIDSGLSREDALKTEEKIYKSLPNQVESVRVKSFYSPVDKTTNLNIRILKKPNSLCSVCKNYKFETQSDEQVKNLYSNLADKIKELADMYGHNKPKN